VRGAREALISAWCPRGANLFGTNADVAQLVEHHLAKVRVAGSNPVVRSRKVQVRVGKAGDTLGGIASKGKFVSLLCHYVQREGAR